GELAQRVEAGVGDGADAVRAARRQCSLLGHRGASLQSEPGAESELAAARVPAGQRGDAALETVSCGGQAGAACASLGVEGPHGGREAGAAGSCTPEVL